MIEDRLLRPSMVIVSNLERRMIKTANQSLARIFEELY